MKFFCSVCEAPAMAVAPGTEKTTVKIGGGRIVVEAGSPDSAWCERHWIKKFGAWEFFTQAAVHEAG